MNAILSLTFEIQLVIVCGYLGYWVSTIGINHKSSTTDTIMQTLVFATMAKLGLLTYQVFLSFCQIRYYLGQKDIHYVELFSFLDALNIIGAIIFALLFAIGGSVLWRKKWRSLTTSIMKYFNIHRYDHRPTALASLTEEFTDSHTTSISVWLKNGTYLESRLIDIDRKLPLREGRIDADGSVLMYITIKKEPEKKLVKYLADDTQISYIPASEIARLNIDWDTRPEIL